MKPLLAACLLAMPFLSFAEPPPAVPTGYVVRMDSAGIYLDFGQENGASAGQPFIVFSEGEELKHPVTGQSLGRLETTLAQGTLREVLPKYSIGTLGASAAEIKPGMRARLGAKTAPPPLRAEAPGGVALRAPRWKSPVFDYQITGMAVADFQGDGKPWVALSDAKTAALYPYPPQDDKPLARFSHPGIAPRIVSLEAGDVNQNGRAELFVSLHNGTFDRFETVVLELGQDAKGSPELKQIADIPWVVRGHQDAAGRRVLAVQQLVEDTTFPFSNIYPLVFKDGKYGPGKGAIRHKRVDWIYDFTTADLDGHAPAVMFLTTTEHLRVQFDKGYWKTPDAYGQTPIRIRWHGRLLHFHPPILAAYDAQKKAGIFLVKNISMLGTLSEPFGLFNSAEIHRKSWNGVSLQSDWRAELGGYSPALALVGDPQEPKDLAVAVVGSSGKSSLWIYDP